MKNWNHIVLAAVAALSLQACEVQVNTGATKVQAPQASLPENTPLNASATTTAVAPPPAEPVAPVEAAAVQLAPAVPAETTAAEPEPTPPVPVAEAPAALPAQPDTSMLGAPPAPAPAPAPAATATPAAPATPVAAAPATASNAAPTELSLFIEANEAAVKTAADKKAVKREKKS